ncbi:MAG TPA: GNAT family protein [Bacilli bacterium]|nr:GNAT family protein [Bacilli bacterium]
MIKLKGNHVILRDLTEQDVEVLYHRTYEAEDREYQKWNGPYFTIEPKTREAFREQLQPRLDAVGTEETRRALVIEADGKLIGQVSWYWVSEVTNWMEAGIVIMDSRYWSGGYGTEAFRMWVDYLFAHMDIVRLGLATWSGNERMIGLARKLGMIEEARIRKARIVDGEYYDSVKMGILREEWEAL